MEKVKKIQRSVMSAFFIIIISLFPLIVYADTDPFTKTGQKITEILFGTLGSALCALIMGSTFIMAKVGKVSWDRFVQIGLYTAGFLGTPSIIAIIQGWVGY